MRLQLLFLSRNIGRLISIINSQATNSGGGIVTIDVSGKILKISVTSIYKPIKCSQKEKILNTNHLNIYLPPFVLNIVHSISVATYILFLVEYMFVFNLLGYTLYNKHTYIYMFQDFTINGVRENLLQCDGLTFVGTDELGGHVGNLLKGKDTTRNESINFTYTQDSRNQC